MVIPPKIRIRRILEAIRRRNRCSHDVMDMLERVDRMAQVPLALAEIIKSNFIYSRRPDRPSMADIDLLHRAWSKIDRNPGTFEPAP